MADTVNMSVGIVHADEGPQVRFEAVQDAFAFALSMSPEDARLIGGALVATADEVEGLRAPDFPPDV